MATCRFANPSGFTSSSIGLPRTAELDQVVKWAHAARLLGTLTMKSPPTVGGKQGAKTTQTTHIPPQTFDKHSVHRTESHSM